jgi:homoserine kinase type II
MGRIPGFLHGFGGLIDLRARQVAVYTHVTEDKLAGLLADYAIGAALSFTGIAQGVENSNYRLETEKGRFILTLYEKRVKAEDLPFFIGLMEHLGARGVSCPRPVKRRDGTTLSTLAGRPAAIITFLEGFAVTHPAAPHCRAAGAALGALHRTGAGYGARRANALGPAGWPALAHAIAGRADAVAPKLAATIEEELGFLEKAWPRSLPSGVIHADLFPDNVFFLKGEVSGLIDFYFACNDFTAYDLAVMLNAWCFDAAHRFQPESAKALVAGYVSERELAAAELKALPTLARGAALRFLLTRTIDWLDQPKDALVRPKDPVEYLTKLRFHRAVAGPEGYGLGA